jgi:hypothetical protein
MLDTPWEAFAKIVQLTIHPSKPTRDIPVRVVKEEELNTLHPISSFRQDVSHKPPVLRCPSSHGPVGVYNRLDVILDVLLLSPLIM